MKYFYLTILFACMTIASYAQHHLYTANGTGTITVTSDVQMNLLILPEYGLAPPQSLPPLCTKSGAPVSASNSFIIVNEAKNSEVYCTINVPRNSNIYVRVVALNQGDHNCILTPPQPCQ